jgi:RNA polymerase sigma-B factor
MSSAAALADAAAFEQHRRAPSSATREDLVTRFLPLARSLARRYQGRAEMDDLNQVAAFALLKAIDRFDPERGLAFSTFAVPTILGELRRYFRDLGWTVRVPRDVQELKLRIDKLTGALTSELGRSPTPAELAERTGASVEQVVEALGTVSAHQPDSLDRRLADDGDEAIDLLSAGPDPGYRQVEDEVYVGGLLEALPERERLILKLRFQDELTQAEIGERVGLSQMHVSRLIRQSIARLQQEASTVAA